VYARWTERFPPIRSQEPKSTKYSLAGCDNPDSVLRSTVKEHCYCMRFIERGCEDAALLVRSLVAPGVGGSVDMERFF
jgi:hypothetical protein